MKNYGQDRKSKIVESTPALALLGIVIVVFSWTVARFSVRMAETARNKKIVEEKVLALREQKTALVADIEKLETERGKEEFVRENFGLAREGEEVIVVVAPEPPPPEPEKSALKSLFGTFLNLFK